MNNDFTNQTELIVMEQADLNLMQFDFNDTFSQALSQNLQMLSQTVTWLQKQSKDIKEIYKNMQVMKNEMDETKQEVKVLANEVKEAVDEMRNHIHLSDPEISDIKTAINRMTTIIAGELYSMSYFSNLDEFTDYYRRVQIGLLSMLRKRFGANSYKKIRHIDFPKALEVAKSFTTKDYINYVEAFNRYKKLTK